MASTHPPPPQPPRASETLGVCLNLSGQLASPKIELLSSGLFLWCYLQGAAIIQEDSASYKQTPSTGLPHPSFNHCCISTIGSRKLSANKQFVGAQTVVSLLQTTQIKQGMSFIATNKVYTSTNKTTII